MNTWYEAECTCGVKNFINNGDPNDLTYPDEMGFKCWNCGKTFSVADGEPEEVEDEDGVFSEGDPLPGFTKEEIQQFKNVKASLHDLVERSELVVFKVWGTDTLGNKIPAPYKHSRRNRNVP